MLAFLVTLAAAACERPSGPRALPADIDALPRTALPPRVDGAARGIALSYLQAGDPDGRRVIFVHGTPGHAREWADFLLACPPGVNCIAVDRPGFGRTLPVQPVSSLAIQADAIAPLAIVAGGKRAILVGHSLGAPIVAQLAIEHPDRVGGLLLLAGAMDPDLERVMWLQRVGAWPPIEALLPRRLRTTNRELLPLKQQLQALASRLGELRIPVSILHGSRDPLVPYENVAFDRRAFAQAAIRIDTIQGQNHFLPWNETARVQAALVQLLREAR
jgi:pimeloyl-ACP methyl ester carboxylesterase